MKIESFFEHKIYSSVIYTLILLYTLLLIPYEDIAKKIQIIFILGSLPVFFYCSKDLFKDPIFKIFGAVLIVSILSWLNSYIYLPEIANSMPKIDRLAKLFGFVFIAYWLHGNLHRVYLLWFTFMMSFILGCFVSADFIKEIGHGINGRRVDFGIKNAQFTAMFAGVTILTGLYLICESIVKVKAFGNIAKTTKFLFLVALTLILLLLLFIVIVSQSRQVWIAIVICVITFPLMYLTIYKKHIKKILLTTAVCIFGISVLVSQSSFVQKRSLNEFATIEKIISGDFNDIPMTSFGIRFNSWLAAAEWIEQRPILGSGPAAIKEVIKQSDLFTGKLKIFAHLHNYHVELVVAYGVLGIIVVYYLYYWVIRSLFLAMKERPELAEITLLSIVFVVFWAFINSFETYNGRSFGVYTHNIMFAGFYTFYLTSKLSEKKEI